MENSTLVDKGMLQQAGELVSALQEGDQEQARQIVDEMTHLREKEMFQDIGRMARQLHDALIGLHADSKIINMTVNQIPDAKDCLGNVVGMTENAAHHTMTLVENILPICDDMGARVAELKGRCEKLAKESDSGEGVRLIAEELDEFFTIHHKKSAEVSNGLREILIAQEYQDLTGQMIKRIIDLVQQIENALVEMIRASGAKVKSMNTGPGGRELDAITSQDGVDDLLSSMGF